MSTDDQGLRAGKEVLSYCGKCKLPLAHVIITMKDDANVGKCECKTCKAKHNYRNPDGTAKKVSAAAAVTNRWKEAMEKASDGFRPYAMDQHFQVGEFIEHATFGKGFVEQTIAENKIDVLFEHSNRLLICNHKPATD